MAENSAGERLSEAWNRRCERRQSASHAASPQCTRGGCASLARHDAADPLEAPALIPHSIPVQWNKFSSLISRNERKASIHHLRSRVRDRLHLSSGGALYWPDLRADLHPSLREVIPQSFQISSTGLRGGPWLRHEPAADY